MKNLNKLIQKEAIQNQVNQNQINDPGEQDFYAKVLLEDQKINVNLFCQFKLKIPADHLIIFTDREKFQKSKFVRKHYSMTHVFYQDSEKQMKEYYNPHPKKNLSGFAEEIIHIYQDQPKGSLNIIEIIQEIKFNTVKNIIQALESITRRPSKQTKRIMISSNSIFPEIYDLQQQAELFTQALSNLKNIEYKLEIFIVSQNKYELATYLHQLNSYSKNQEQQKQNILQTIQSSHNRNNFRNQCPQGHTLILQQEPLFQVLCLFCKQTAFTRQKCDICNTYACEFCVENVINRFECTNKHNLIYCDSKTKRSFICDECQLSSFYVHSGSWQDRACDLDICGYCMREKIEVGFVEKKIIQLKVLQNVYKKQLIFYRLGTLDKKLFRTLDCF